MHALLGWGTTLRKTVFYVGVAEVPKFLILIIGGLGRIVIVYAIYLPSKVGNCGDLYKFSAWSRATFTTSLLAN